MAEEINRLKSTATEKTNLKDRLNKKRLQTILKPFFKAHDNNGNKSSLYI